MATAQRQLANTRKQIRGFVIVWTFITFMMGLATFLAIYFTSNPNIVSAAANSVIADTVDTEIGNSGNNGDDGDAANQLVALPTNTPQATTIPPTVTPPPVATEEATAMEVAQAETTPKTLGVVEISTDTPPPPTVMPTPRPVDDTAFQVGIQVQESPDFNPDNQDGWIRAVAEDLKLPWIKQQVRWEVMEENRGEVNWATLDLVMTSTAKFDVKVMLSIVTAPNWAREQGVNLNQHGPPANFQDYVNFVTAIVQRYPGQVHAIEVWNEQNLDREWTSTTGVNPTSYVNMLQVTYQAVKAIDPGIIIISGALSPTGVHDGYNIWDDFFYMDGMIQAGFLNYLDCVGAHHNGYNVSSDYRFNEIPNDPSAIFRGPFDNPNHSWSFRSTLEGYATRIANAGSDKKLCITEFGWPVSEDVGAFPRGFEFAQDNSLQEQAQYISGALTNMNEWGFVWIAYIWNFNYGPQAGWDPNNDNVPYSMIGPDFVFRPAYDAIREWQAGYASITGA